MELKDVAKETMHLAGSLLNKKIEGIVEIGMKDKNWSVLVEALERKAIPDTQDHLGRYEFELTTKGELVKYSQKLLRKRGECLREGD